MFAWVKIRLYVCIVNEISMKRIVLSTSGVNRYGYRVLTSGIQLDRFLKNPVMFFGHSTRQFPIGRWTDVKIEGDVLSGIPVFDEVTEESKICKLLYEKGHYALHQLVLMLSVQRKTQLWRLVGNATKRSLLANCWK